MKLSMQNPAKNQLVVPKIERERNFCPFPTDKIAINTANHIVSLVTDILKAGPILYDLCDFT